MILENVLDWIINKLTWIRVRRENKIKRQERNEEFEIIMRYEKELIRCPECQGERAMIVPPTRFGNYIAVCPDCGHYSRGAPTISETAKLWNKSEVL